VIVDLRSDTLTMPTADMRRAMADAELGDDVFGEDPTVNRLEQRAADLLGKESAVFVASGTMGNLLAVLALTRSGQEVIADADAHVFLSEGGGAAALGGVQVRQVPTEAGVMTAEQVHGAVRPTDDYHAPLAASRGRWPRCGRSAAPPTRTASPSTWTGRASSTRRSRTGWRPPRSPPWRTR